MASNILEVSTEITKLSFNNDGTAQGVAKQRMIETLAKPAKRVINDPYAEKFTLGSGFLKFLGWTFQAFYVIELTMAQKNPRY